MQTATATPALPAPYELHVPGKKGVKEQARRCIQAAINDRDVWAQVSERISNGAGHKVLSHDRALSAVLKYDAQHGNFLSTCGLDAWQLQQQLRTVLRLFYALDKSWHLASLSKRIAVTRDLPLEQ